MTEERKEYLRQCRREAYARLPDEIKERIRGLRSKRRLAERGKGKRRA